MYLGGNQTSEGYWVNAYKKASSQAAQKAIPSEQYG